MGVYERYVENAFSSVANDNYEKGSTFDSEGESNTWTPTLRNESDS
jgi:hypothetical protein